MTYKRIEINKIYIDEFIKLNQFIAGNYDWEAKEHLAYIDRIRKVGLTNEYKGNFENKHQVFEGVILKVKKNMPKDKKDELIKIITNSV
ncbi:MAG: hypothetical protein ABSE89_11405 [Sedimentisphaerales bacterium]